MARMAAILSGTAPGDYARAFYFRTLRQVPRSLELLRLAIDEHPRDDALREEYLRPSFGALIEGKASPEILEVANGLSPQAARVLIGAAYALRNNWQEVAKLDQQLGQIPWTDAWYPEAMDLRVNWRLQVTDPVLARRYADEALILLDRVAILTPNLSTYGLRARAGVASGRPEVVLESLSNYARLALGLIRVGMETPGSLRNESQVLEQMLDSIATRPALDPARVAEVRAEIGQLLPK